MRVDGWLRPLRCVSQAERLRGEFVNHEGKQELEVVRDGFVIGAGGNDWLVHFGPTFPVVGRVHLPVDSQQRPHTVLVQWMPQKLGIE